MMAVEMEHGRDGGAVGEGQHHDAARLGAERGGGGCGEGCRSHPVALGVAERQIDAKGALEIEPGRQAIGGQRRSGRKRRGPDQRLRGCDQPGERAGLLAVMQLNR